jgi:hypothetical protein
MVKLPFQKHMTFAPVPLDDDELIRSIADDPNRQDDRWQLHDDIDPDGINHFWDDALKDIGEQDDFSG